MDDIAAGTVAGITYSSARELSVDHYPHVGMTRHDSAWFHPPLPQP